MALPNFETVFIDLDEVESDFPEVEIALSSFGSMDKESLLTFICGVGAMTRSVKKALVGEGFERRRVKTERFN